MQLVHGRAEPFAGLKSGDASAIMAAGRLRMTRCYKRLETQRALLTHYQSHSSIHSA